jgi:hypothetical protein
MFGVSKTHLAIAGVSLLAYALVRFVQSPAGLNFKIPVIGQYLPQ